MGGHFNLVQYLITNNSSFNRTCMLNKIFFSKMLPSFCATYQQISNFFLQPILMARTCLKLNLFVMSILNISTHQKLSNSKMRHIVFQCWCMMFKNILSEKSYFLQQNTFISLFLINGEATSFL